MAMITVSIESVKELRERTFLGMSACKAALKESDGDLDEAVKLLRIKGTLTAGALSGKATNEGQVTSYIHPGSKLAVLVEVNCQTDFGARSEIFQSFCSTLAMQIAGMKAQWLTRDCIPTTVQDHQTEVFTAQVADKPENPTL